MEIVQKLTKTKISNNRKPKKKYKERFLSFAELYTQASLPIIWFEREEISQDLFLTITKFTFHTTVGKWYCLFNAWACM